MKHHIPVIAILAFPAVLLAQHTRQVKPQEKPGPVPDSALSADREKAPEGMSVLFVTQADIDGKYMQDLPALAESATDFFGSAGGNGLALLGFRRRGYAAGMHTMHLNGASLENLGTGSVETAAFAGVSLGFHERETVAGAAALPNAFGSIGNNVWMDAFAGDQRSRTEFSAGLSDSRESVRISIVHHTGFNPGRWAVSVACRLAMSGEGYVPGTYYNGFDGAIAIDKKLGNNQRLSLVVFASPTESGKQGAAVAEMDSLAGNIPYNPYWGYQGSYKRNAYITRALQPSAILSGIHEWGTGNSIRVSLLASNGYHENTSLDWYAAPDPRPDYYQYLPSFYPAPLAASVQALLRGNEQYRQINWQRLYEVNETSFESVPDANGIAGNMVSGRRSHYVVAADMVNSLRAGLNVIIHASFRRGIRVVGGASWQFQSDRKYRRLEDLLGGDFFLDVNQFAQSSFPLNTNATQSDLHHINHIIHANEVYGYDYQLRLSRNMAWAQVTKPFHRGEAFLAIESTQFQFQREGNMQNGLFPDHSFGSSPKTSFFTVAVKAGAAIQLNGHQSFFLHAACMQRPPLPQNVYLSERTKDIQQQNLRPETLISVEGGYQLQTSVWSATGTLYATQEDHVSQVLTYYDDDLHTLVNDALSGIGRSYVGVEIAGRFNYHRKLTIGASLAVGKYIYTTRPQAIVTADNSVTVLSLDTLYIKQFRLAGTPQQAISVRAQYSISGNWRASLTMAYGDGRWLDFNPIRRTFRAVQNIVAESTAWHSVLDEGKLSPEAIVVASAGYSCKAPRSWKLKKQAFIALDGRIQNLTGNAHIPVVAAEQLRFDFQGHDPAKFPPKYLYAFGLNYSLTASIRF